MKLVWFTGMVEDISDPCQIGRVRVRCFGLHVPKEKDVDGNGVPDLDTEHLLWAPCILPVTDPNINGVAGTPAGLMPGSMVIGFFRDGADMQDPLIVGGISGARGYETKYDTNFGYGDPNGMFSYSSFHNDFPEDSTSLGSINGHGARYAQYGGNFLGQNSTAGSVNWSSFEPQTATVPLTGGTVDAYLKIAASFVGTVEDQGSNRDSSGNIKKFWSAISWDGSKGRQPYCAAFISYCLKESGVLPEEYLPATASAKAFIPWAARKPWATIINHPRVADVQPGDIIKYTYSHVGFAASAADPSSGRCQTIEGNCGDPGGSGAEGVFQKFKRVSDISSLIRLNFGQAPQTTGLPINGTVPSVIPGQAPSYIAPVAPWDPRSAAAQDDSTATTR